MTELLSQSKVSLFDMTDPVVVVEELIFSAFNGDCNDCTRAAFGLSNALIPGLDGNALLTSMCGANFTGEFPSFAYSLEFWILMPAQQPRSVPPRQWGSSTLR
jgi:hypothetical protein